MKTPVVSSVDELIEWRLADIERGQEDMHAYQIEDYEFFKRTPFSIGIIGLGLGKSVIGATLLRDLIYEWEHDGLILIVGPIPIITNSWHDEVRQWRHLVHLGPDMITLREDDDDPRIKQAGKAARMRGEPEGAAMTKIRQQIRHELARSNKSIHMINFEGLEWLIDFWGPRWPYRTVIVDECFVGSTPISCEGSVKRIDEVKPGELVLTPYGALPVKAVMRKPIISQLVRVEFSDSAVTCTDDHEFFTNCGWVKAKDLAGKVVYGESDFARVEVQALRKEFLDPQTNADVLRKKLCSAVSLGGPCDSQGHDGEVHPSRQCFDGWSHSLEQRCAMGRGCQGEIAQDSDPWRTQENPWRERDGYDCCGDTASHRFEDGVGTQLCSSNRSWVGRLSEPLQTGLCVAFGEVVLGGGREQSQQSTKTAAGRTEDGISGGARVDRVSRVECEGEEYVYDLQVDGSPCYFAGGVLVHNCSMLKDHKSNRFKRLAMVRNTPGMITRMHLLTGTPASESYMGLFAQIYLLDLGDRFGSEVTTFQRRYFYQDRWSQKWKIRPGAEEEILTKIADITTIRDAKDYRHVEDPIISLRYVHLTDEEMNIYKRMQKEFIVQLPEGSIVEAKNAAALTQKLSQLASGVLYETTIELDMEADDPEDADRIEVKKVHKIHDHKITEMKEIVKELDGLNVLVAYQHRSSLERLQKAFPKAIKWHKSGRDKEAWNAGKINMMLMHPRSGGHGNNLQKGGHVVIFFDIPWSREQFVQLLGRLARQGQTEVVRVIQLVSKGTIDETIARAQRDKRMHEEELYAILQRLIAAARRSHKR